MVIHCDVLSNESQCDRRMDLKLLELDVADGNVGAEEGVGEGGGGVEEGDGAHDGGEEVEKDDAEGGRGPLLNAEGTSQLLTPNLVR